MNKSEAIDQFIRNNYKLLRRPGQFDKKRYTQIKREYFGKILKYQFGNPPDKEICDRFVKLLIKAEKILREEDLEQLIPNLRFLKLNNVTSSRYAATISSIAKTYAIKEELAGLKSIEKIEKEFEWVKKERTQDIEDAISQKKEEYRRLPSIIDDVDFEEPEQLAQRSKETDWWQDLNLRDNPFQGPLDGFSTIDKSMYQQIIVETAPIVWALDKLEKEPLDIFHKGFLLAGEFGTGKTTFYDFIAPHLTRKQVEPIRIALTESVNEAYYVRKFEREVCIAISKLTKQYNLQRTGFVADFTEAKIHMMELQNIIKGFLIFIDDLHKHTDLDLVFRFLSHLQIVKNNFSRDDINVVFVTAGFSNWREKIRKDPALMGFFDAPDQLTLPEVTPSLAAQAIKRRLQAFSVNLDKELGIKEEFLTSIFKKVRAERGDVNIGFRPYIQEAIQMFEQKQFDILSVNITMDDPQVSQEIKSKLEANSDFAESLHKLIFGGGIQKQPVRERTLRVLCEIYLRKGVTEDEDFFNSQKFYFKRLREASLIQKFDREADGQHTLAWNVNPLVAKLNKQIIDEFQLSMEDYLVPIYSTSIQAVTAKKELTKVEVYEKDLKQWQKQLNETAINSLRKALASYSEHIFSFTSSKSISPNSLPSIDKIEESVWTMMKAIIRYESPLLLDICGETNIEGWRLRHRSLECSQQFLSLLRSARSSSFTAADCTRLLSFADETFRELWNDLKESIAVYRSSGATCYMLPKRVLRTIYTEHATFLSTTAQQAEYFDSLESFTTEIEQSLRQYLLVSCILIFGPYHIRVKHYPENIRKYITKRLPAQSTSYESYNEFENLNRGQYRSLFQESGKSTPFYRYIIRPVITRWSSQDLNAFFELFGDMNIITSHKKLSSTEDTKKDLPTFFKLACKLIADMSLRLKSLLMRENTILANDIATTVVFGAPSEKYHSDRREVRPGEISLPEVIFAHDISEALRSNTLSDQISSPDNTFGFFELDMLDVDGTIIKFGRGFSEVISLVAYYLAKKRLRGNFLYGATIWLRDIS